jgi:hypothetical protein
MIERGEDVGLARKPGDPFGLLGKRRRQDLDRHLSPELQILRAIDLPHPACTKGGEDLIGTETGAGGKHRRGTRRDYRRVRDRSQNRLV